MKILGIHHVSFLVADTIRSLEFYSGILGAEQDLRRPDLGFPGAWIRIGDQQIHLLELPNPDESVDRPEHGGRDRHAAFWVDDLDDLVTRLESEGIEISLSKSGRKALFCRDPDMNALEFIQVT